MTDASVKTLISPTTSAVATKAPHRIHRRSTVMAGGATDAATLGAEEEAEIFYSVNGGTSWHELYDRDGNQVLLTQTLGPITLYGPLLIGVTKPSTAQSVGIYVDEGAS